MNDTNLFQVKINYIVLTTDIINRKQYVLSINPNEIELPSFILNIENKLDLDKYIINFISQYVNVSSLELIPQLIRLDTNIDETKFNTTVNSIYGFLVEYTDAINNCYWKEFHYTSMDKFTHILLETVQKLR